MSSEEVCGIAAPTVHMKKRTRVGRKIWKAKNRYCLFSNLFAIKRRQIFGVILPSAFTAV
jgi:hypothetical protein